MSTVLEPAPGTEFEAAYDAPRRHVEIMDTTLRDGEQTEGISLLPEEKLVIAEALLREVGVDRIEVASARVSKGEMDAVRRIMAMAREHGFEDRVEILGFVDFDMSVDWALQTGVKTINLLTKGSERHCREQLRRTLAQHVADIRRTVLHGVENGLRFNVYLEDWSGGALGSPDYVDEMIGELDRMPIHRVMLCDTLGILNPRLVGRFVGRHATAFPDRHFDFHGHNDYGLATANVLEAVAAGAAGVHVTVNGMGERAGNTSLDETVVALRDQAGVTTNVREESLKRVSHKVEIFSGRRISVNKPVTGDCVFTQTAGIHADGDLKGGLYESRLHPSRFGAERRYAMGKLMGKASLELNLETLGITLTAEQKARVMERIVELGDQKKIVTGEDLPYIVSDVLETPVDRVFEIVDFMIASNRGLLPTATIRVRARGKEFQATGSGDGGYDAFMKALKSLEDDMGIKVPALEDYEVRIPPGGRTDALVETTIKWEGGLRTRGVHGDQLVAAIEATAHAMNLIALRSRE